MNQEFKGIIADIKHKYSLTQAQIAERLGVSRPYISEVINGRAPFNDTLKAKIQEVFPDYKMSYDEPEPEPEANTVPLLPIFAQAGHLRNLKAICNFALDEELTSHYPFRKFRIRTEETRKKDLTIAQLRAYATADITYRNDAMHRDVFMLLFYFRGMNISDLAGLTWKDVRNGRVNYRRNKTGRLFSIRIEPEAQAIIDRWKGEQHLLSVFDRYKKPNEYNRRLSEALKRICRPDGTPIEPDCTSNWARHTWATLAADLDFTEEALTWGMGHKTGHRVTEIYIHRNDAKCDEANRAVIDYLWGKETVPHLTT